MRSLASSAATRRRYVAGQGRASGARYRSTLSFEHSTRLPASSSQSERSVGWLMDAFLHASDARVRICAALGKCAAQALRSPLTREAAPAGWPMLAAAPREGRGRGATLARLRGSGEAARQGGGLT